MQNPIIIIDITGGGVFTVDDLLAAAVPSGSFLVSALNAQLGSTVWQGGGSGTPAWGAIVGTLADQTDLQAALDAKAASSHTHTLSQISDIDVSADMVAFDQGLRPGLYDDLDSPPVGTIFEGVNDGHLYWCHRDGSVHLLCDSGGYGGSAWGSITGTLSEQTDLQTELDAKQPLHTILSSISALADSNPTDVVPFLIDGDTLGSIPCPAFARTLMNAESAAVARATLGLSIGSNVQAFDAELEAIAGLASAADKAPYFTGSGTAALMTVTTAARGLLDDANAAAMRSTLGLVIGSNVQAFDAELQAIAGLASAADTVPYFTGSGTASLMTVTSTARSLLDDATEADMLATLGGTAATGTGGIVRAASPTLTGTPVAPTASAGTSTTQIATTAFAAAAVEKATTPGLRASRYYGSFPAAAVTTFTITANRLYYFPFFVPVATTFTRIGINVTSGVAGSARLGIYNNVNGIPSGAPLLDAGTVDVSSTGEKEIVISQALPVGWHWLALVSDVAPTLTAENLATAVLLCNVGSLSGAAGNVTHVQQTFTFAALPTPSSITGANMTTPPRVWLRL